MARMKLISVIGAGNPQPFAYEQAEQIGRMLAHKGYGVVTGGKAGVMEAASKGCAHAGGFVLGILPESHTGQANKYCSVAVPTGLGQGRNLLVVLTGEGAIAVSGGAGTLSEIGHALKHGKPVISLGSWNLDGLPQAQDPAQAVDMLLERLED